MTNPSFLWTDNASAANLADVPRLSMADFREALIAAVRSGKTRILAFFATPENDQNDQFFLTAVLANPETHKVGITSAVTGKSYPALTPEAEAFHWFEREIAEQYGIVPEGHPWLKPIRFQKSETASDAWNRTDNDIQPGITHYFQPEGEEMHEVAVGPIHAGVIEPGHFRFQCMGETVYHLEIELGYQHRGIENLLTGPLTCRALAIAETIAGDTTVGHSLAFCKALEALSETVQKPDSGTMRLRAIALELERLANHIGDLGALAGDVAFLPTASFCGRIRGEYLNMTAELCGNRFGRGLVVPGGAAFTLEKERAGRILAKMQKTYIELKQALDLMFDSPTVLDRLENTGIVGEDVLKRIGAVGTATRAGGVHADSRMDLPIAEYEAEPPKGAFTVRGGDVMARAKVRYEEIKASHEWLFRILPEAVSEKTAERIVPELLPGKIAVSVVEGWRGEICHVLITDDRGAIRRAKIVDPSFHNWFALALALRNGQISDFPICNKSFNLSYCGHDL